MTPEEKARCVIDDKLCQSGWVIQDLKRLNLTASLGVAVREFPTSTVFSFHRPETLFDLIQQPDTIRNNMKQFPLLDVKGFRKCQINAINNLDQSFADNRPRALVQMATEAGKTFG